MNLAMNLTIALIGVRNYGSWEALISKKYPVVIRGNPYFFIKPGERRIRVQYRIAAFPFASQ